MPTVFKTMRERERESWPIVSILMYSVYVVCLVWRIFKNSCTVAGLHTLACAQTGNFNIFILSLDRDGGREREKVWIGREAEGAVMLPINTLCLTHNNSGRLYCV